MVFIPVLARSRGRSVKTSSCKSKGRALQKHVASEIQDVFDLPETDVVSRPMGSSGEDIMMSNAAYDLLPLALEVKNTKTFPSLAALRQAKEHAKNIKIPPRHEGEPGWEDYITYSPDYIKGAVCWKPPGKGYDETIIYFNLREFLRLWKGWTEKNVKA